jgi:hypothetical protein
MSKGINGKLFLILLFASIIAYLLVFPYALALSPSFAKVFTPFVLFVQLIQTLIEFSIAI